jgi:pimeloyl-ACP methyl ester carboxylesterase
MPLSCRAMTRLALAFLVLATASCGSGTLTPASSPPSPPPASAQPAASSPSAAPSRPRATVGPIGSTCLTPQEQAAVVRFPSDSGVDLGGVLLGGGHRGVVLVHETHASLCEWMPYARWLARRGHRVLAFDLNGLGSSPASPGSPSAPRWDLDVAAAAGVLRDHGASRVALVGANIGGIASLVAATEVEPPVEVVVVLSAQVEMSGLDGRTAAANLRQPVLYVTSTSDEYLGDMRALAAATSAAPVRLEVVDVIGHGVDLVDPEMTPKADAVRALIEQFIADPPSA